jgi:hypothetical protein
MWLPFLLIVGVIAIVASSSASARGEYGPSISGPMPMPMLPSAPVPPPGPISVFGEFIRIGQAPPPMVILCAIAEAEAIGRCDLASDIVRVFVAPVVYQHENARLYVPGRAPGTARAVAVPPGPSTQLWPPEANYPGFDARFGAMERARRGEVPARLQPGAASSHERGSCERPRSPRAVAPAAPVAVMPSNAPRFPASDEEIRAMLNTNPEEFIEMARRARPAIVDVPVDTANAIHAAAIDEVARQAAQSTPPIQSTPPMDPPAQATGLPPEVVAQMQEDVGLHTAADQTRAMAPGSPIGGVSDEAWRQFVMRLERETPSYQSARHVGQYRQRRERLAELGIDPMRILGSAEAQRAALDVDLIDAHRHAADGGLLGNLGRRIALPGSDAPCTITLSGVLGVIQCAGLDGAASWLESQRDRKRFPHTTQAFVRSNGVF